MTTEVIRGDGKSLTIRWVDTVGSVWSVVKKFNTAAHIMEGSLVFGPCRCCYGNSQATRQSETALHKAAFMADRMDSVFETVEDFDSVVTLSAPPTACGYPAIFYPRDDDGKIYIAIAAKS